MNKFKAYHKRVTIRLLSWVLGISVLATPTMGKDIAVDMFILSSGSWVTLQDKLGESGKDSYFNSFKPDIYFHVHSIKGYIGVPLTLTLESYTDSLRYAFYPADLTFYLGKQFGPVEPRLGIDIPLRYPIGNLAWIGSGNTNLLWGLGFNLGKYRNNKLSLGGELMGRIYLTGLKEGARIGRGSQKAYLAVKAAYALSPKWNAGIEAFPYFSYFTETDWTVDDTDPSFSSIGFLPYVFAGFQPTPKSEISIKLAMGGEYAGSAGHQSFSRAAHGAVNVNFYFW